MKNYISVEIQHKGVGAKINLDLGNGFVGPNLERDVKNTFETFSKTIIKFLIENK